MTADLVCNALNIAIKNKRPGQGLIVHSDRGSQYCSHAYHKIIKQHHFKSSMSGKGSCYDNTLIESRWGMLRNELVYQQDYKTDLLLLPISSNISSCTTIRLESKRVCAINRQDKCGLITIVRLRN